MIRMGKAAAIVVVCGWLAGGVARAGPPDPANSECQSGHILLVGHDGHVGDPAGEYCVIIRDFNNTPLPNDLVTIDFSQCGFRIAAEQLDAGVTVDCVAQTVSRRTDSAGRACFRVIGKRAPGLGCSGAPNTCGQIFSEALGFICNPGAATYDLVDDGGSGLSASDLSTFLSLFFCGANPMALDYVPDGLVTAADLSKWLSVFFAGRSPLSGPPAANCP